MKTYSFFLIISLTIFYMSRTDAQPLQSLAQQQESSATHLPDEGSAGEEGSPYLYNDWIRGEIILPDSTVYDEVYLLYDVVEDRLLAKKQAQQAIVIDKSKIRGFALGKPGISSFTDYVKAAYLENFQAVPEEQFVQVLYDGPTALYAVLSKANEKDILAEVEAEYYVQSPEGKMVLLAPEKAAVLQIFSDEKNKVEKFIRENNIMLDEGADLVQVVMFYDQLQS